MIASYFEGRARIRHKALKNADNMENVLALLKFYPGVHDAVPNLATGSLLVTYDPEAIPLEDLQKALQALEENFGPDASSPRRRFKLTRQQENALLNAAFFLTMGSLFLPGGKRIHRYVGGFFAMLALDHYLKRR